jgi:hypothetical protein
VTYWHKGFGSHWYYNTVDQRKIYMGSDGTCCIADGSWMPGVYENFETAELAFNFDDEHLSYLQQCINPSGVITHRMLEMLLEDGK